MGLLTQWVRKIFEELEIISIGDNVVFFLIVRNDKNPYVKSLMRTLEIKWSHGEIYLVNQFGGTCEYGSFSSFENHFLIQRMEDIDEVKKIIDQLKEFKDGRE